MTGTGRGHRRSVCLAVAGIALAGLLAAACSAPLNVQGSQGTPTSVVDPHLTGIQKIQHVIIIMQENRSFDSYFGTYPGADGIPMRNGVPTVCVPNPKGPCTRPYHDTADINGGGPHSEPNSVADVDGGKMDGFIRQRDAGHKQCRYANDPACSVRASATPDVMGYHTAAEIPNYWAYAKNFVLADHMFEPVKSWSLPDHLYTVSGWSAKCANRSPTSCVNNIVGPYGGKQIAQAVAQEVNTGHTPINMSWTDITWLLHAHHVSWAYYVQKGTQPDCANSSALTCSPVKQAAKTPGIWNPLPLFVDVQQDHQVKNIQGMKSYFAAAKAGTLPSVSWITPSDPNSEHPPASVHQGQAYVTALINAAMKSPAHRRPERLRPAGTGDHHLPLRQEGLHRPPGAQPRRVPEVHRRRFPGRCPPQPQDRRPARSPSQRPGKRLDPGQPGQRLQLQPGAAQAAAAAHEPADRLAVGPRLLLRQAGLPRLHRAAPRLRHRSAWRAWTR